MGVYYVDPAIMIEEGHRTAHRCSSSKINAGEVLVRTVCKLSTPSWQSLAPPFAIKYGPKHENDGATPLLSLLLLLWRSSGVVCKSTASCNAFAVEAHELDGELATESNTKI